MNTTDVPLLDAKTPFYTHIRDESSNLINKLYKCTIGLLHVMFLKR